MTISTKVIAHSISSVTGQVFLTGEWVYPRIVLSELNTHREKSRNSASSRAIPGEKMNELIRADIARPVRFGKANVGMQDAGEHDALINGYTAQEWWDLAVSSAIKFSDGFREAGYAKQVYNRLTEVGSHMKSVVSATSFDNWNWLRDHDDADPTIAALARSWKESVEASTPVILQPGEWHTPYYGDGYWKPALNGDGTTDKFGYTLEQALAISSSCCAQVSFRTADDSLEKAMKVKERLIQDNAVHGSPFEHQGTPIKKSENLLQMNPIPDNFDAYAPTFSVGKVNVPGNPDTWEEGITHVRRDGTFCSGNLRNWIQHRQLIPGHDYESTQK